MLDRRGELWSFYPAGENYGRFMVVVVESRGGWAAYVKHIVVPCAGYRHSQTFGIDETVLNKNWTKVV